LPGERLEIGGGVVRVDGRPLPAPLDLPTPGGGAWTVDDGEVFVLSDARARTQADSRTFGPVPAAGCR
ncbi:MAG: signal peptidase I, partial [Actinobacteria bacterium]|nr:signal peptidase I [Actinomycetota bacterium]NIY10109.1 signal peptidase I [Gemmatimonadota bacterium]NIS36830.1 signal peptidase I [Actinomycetota bacterium]NIU22576.1 signal peptidase I [Actinomycetota bacterium]NIU71320.1 signal peptidase I [Actinomycetota bacterium]